MKLGPLVRRLFGPAEPKVARLYRGAFVDLEREAALIASWCGPGRLLELGCGEGLLTEALARARPDGHILGVDVAPGVGRLFRGDPARVEFRRESIEQLVAAAPASFDAVVVGDVLHHVPWEGHEGFLRLAGAAVAPGGVLVVKEWERRANLAHLLGWCSDTFVTQDRVRYATGPELRERIARALPGAVVEAEARIPPWPNNVALRVRIPAR